MSRYEPNRGAPLFLGWARAVDRALELRNAGMSYPALALVMAEYHGWDRCTKTWRVHLSGRGVAKDPARVASGYSRQFQGGGHGR